MISEDGPGPGAFSVGLLTEDERLVQRVEAIACRARARVEIANDPASASDLLDTDMHAVRVIDTAGLAGLLPDRAARHALAGMDGGIEIWIGAPTLALAGGGPFSVHAYPRGALDAAMAHLQGFFPEVGRDFVVEELILGDAPAIHAVREQLKRLSRYRDVSVLVLGETGTGKELVAEALHRLTLGAGRPFVAVNCSAIPEALFESELFGHEAGSYTGARGTRVGLIEAAAGGTLFLDEVGEMPLSLQPKLLRALESRTFRRVGSNRAIPLSARVVAATNQRVGHADAPRLRSDLYYRLAGFVITLPPLRERRGDVGLLATTLLRRFGTRHGQPGLTLAPAALARLESHHWTGNVRELRSVVEQAAILAGRDTIGANEIDLVLRPPSHPSPVESHPEPAEEAAAAARGEESAGIRALERRLVVQAFSECGNNLSKTSKMLGLPRTTLRAKLRRWGVV